MLLPISSSVIQAGTNPVENMPNTIWSVSLWESIHGRKDHAFARSQLRPCCEDLRQILPAHDVLSADMPYIESNRRFAAYALSTILVPVGLPLPSRQERCGLKIYLAYVLPSQLQLSRILLGACERALILPTSAGEASPPPVLRRTCRCSIPHSARKLQNPHLLTKLHAS